MDGHKCGLCKYRASRKDSLKRHIAQKHNKERKHCECGTFVAPSGMARHKKSSCSLRKQSQVDTTNLEVVIKSKNSENRNYYASGIAERWTNRNSAGRC